MRRLFAIIALSLAAVTLAGCSAGLSGTSVEPQPAPEMLDESVTSDSGAIATDPELRSLPGQPTSSSPREVIITGTLTVVADDPTAAADEAVAITRRAGGRVDGRQEQTATDQQAARATLTLRIPADRLDAALDELKELGEARDTTTSTDDVTMITRDLDARITALQTSVDRLLSLLDRATDVNALVQVESALSQRQAELEGLQAQRRYYSEQVAFSTITLYLLSEQVATPLQPDTFWDGIVVGWEALVVFFTGALVLLGVMLPWLLLLAVLLLIVWVIIRAARRSRRVEHGAGSDAGVGTEHGAADDAADAVPAPEAPAPAAAPERRGTDPIE